MNANPGKRAGTLIPHSPWDASSGLVTECAADAAVGAGLAASGSEAIVPPLALASLLLERLLAHDPSTVGHSLRVAGHVARIVADLPGHPWRGLGATVYAAAVCHDIGKIGVPLAILTAPRPLTAAESTIVREHPAHGLALLRRNPTAGAGADQLLAQACGGHHERWDGAGYPTGLSGKAIAPIARLVGLCDAYDAMREDRPYRKARGHAAALDELQREAGGQFEPALTAYVLAHGLLDEERAANL